MQILVNVLIVFFIILIIHQIFLANIQMKEGFDPSSPSTSQPGQYQQYNTNDPNNAMILAQQNAGNIQVLKQQMDDLNNLNQEVQDISANVVLLQSQVTTIAQAQQQYTSQMAANPTPQISGAVPNSS
jgi:predicted RND superfamily exporter protein